MTRDETIQEAISYVGAITLGTVGGFAWGTMKQMGFAFLMGFAGAFGGLCVKLVWNVVKKKLKSKGLWN